MRIRLLTLAAVMLMVAPGIALAQEAASLDAQTPTLQQRLMPEAAIRLLAPAEAAVAAPEAELAQPAVAQRGAGTGLIVAGAALFVAGLIVGDDAGTLLAVGGAAIGAYGLYLYFR